MSDNAPPPGWSDGMQPVYPAPPPPRRRRAPRVLALTAVLALLLGGGAFAVYKADPFHLFSAGPQASEALPGDALFYVGVDADPSAKQKIAAVRFLDHFSYFKEHSGLRDENSDIRESAFTKILDSTGCTGVTYDETVKPWLGHKFGLALMAPAGTGSTPNAVFAVEVSDTARAKTGLGELAACTKQADGDGFGYAFESHYVLLAETQALADQYAEDAARSSLADDSDFTDDMDSLGDLGVATMWVNVSRIFDAFGGSVEGNGLSPDDLGVLKQSYQRAAATFRFESDSAEIATSVYGDTTAVIPRPNPIVRLPDSTVFAMSESGGAQRVRASWDDIVKAASSDRVDVRQQVSDFEARTGLSLPDDLETLFGDNLLFAVDSNGLTAESLQAGDPSRYDVGARFTTDPAKLSALYDKIVTFVRDQSGSDLPLSKVLTDDGMALATNDDYAKTLAGLDGDLGSSDDFKSVIDDASGKEFVLYFDFDAVESQVVDAMGNSASPPSAQVTDSVTALRAVGITAQTNGHHTLTTLRVSVND